MPEHCAANSCTNRRSTKSKARGITFHKFPRSNVREKWEAALERAGFTATNRTVLCSEHFKPDDFDRTGQTVRLRDGVVPSIFNSTVRLPRLGKSKATFTSRRARKRLSVDTRHDALTSLSQPEPKDTPHWSVFPAEMQVKLQLPDQVRKSRLDGGDAEGEQVTEERYEEDEEEEQRQLKLEHEELNIIQVEEVSQFPGESLSRTEEGAAHVKEEEEELCVSKEEQQLDGEPQQLCEQEREFSLVKREAEGEWIKEEYEGEDDEQWSRGRAAAP